MALTNQQVLNPWLEVMHAQRAQVRGVHSFPVVTGWVNAYLGSPNETALFVTFNRAGLRQVYLDRGRPRFARLAAFQDETPARAGARIAREISSTEQYLATLRWLPRTGGPLRIVLVCPADSRAIWQTACVNTDRLTFEFPDLASLMEQYGVRTDPLVDEEGVQYADSLWAAGALRMAPKIDFAPDWAREHFVLWRWRNGIISAGAVLCALSTLTGTLWLAQAKGIDTNADRQVAASARANAAYQEVAKSFPQTAITPEHLKAAVLALDPLATRPLTPEPLLIQISQALLAAPAFSLSKIDWQVSATAETPAGGALSAMRARPAPAAPGSAAPDRFEVVVLTGALAQERAATPRRRIAAARSAIDALKRIPGVDVTPVRLPLDVSPTGTLKGGDDEASAVADTEPIILRLARKVAP